MLFNSKDWNVSLLFSNCPGGGPESCGGGVLK